MPNEAPQISASAWRVLGILRGHPREPIMYEILADSIGQNREEPVHGPPGSSSGSRVYRAVYAARKWLQYEGRGNRIIRLKPWLNASRGGYMFLPGEDRT